MTSEQTEQTGRSTREIVAENIRAGRALGKLSQEELAARMRGLGRGQWTRQTVSESERAGRSVDVEELVALAVALDRTVGDLLDPTGLDGRMAAGIRVGAVDLGPALARAFTRSKALVTFAEWEPSPSGLRVSPAPEPDVRYTPAVFSELRDLGLADVNPPAEREGER